jgi:hypothetical protein
MLYIACDFITNRGEFLAMKVIQTIESIGLALVIIGGCSADHFATSAMILCGIGCAMMATGQYLERRWKHEHHRRAGVHRR